MNHTSAPTESEQKVDMFWHSFARYRATLRHLCIVAPSDMEARMYQHELDLLDDIEENYVLVTREEWEAS